jgi:hypothetical protein
MADTPFIRGLQSGPVIVQIVQVCPVDNRADTELIRFLAANAIEFVFAEKTAVDRIFGE